MADLQVDDIIKSMRTYTLKSSDMTSTRNESGVQGTNYNISFVTEGDFENRQDLQSSINTGDEVLIKNIAEFRRQMQ